MQTVSITTNGLSFVAEVEGEGDTVALLLHGFPAGRQAWDGQMSRLAALGWKVVAPDLRGYGATGRPMAREAYRIDCLIQDVEGLFEALGARRRVLIGHDWGGMIGWFGALRGLRLDGLVVLNAPHPVALQRALLSWDQRLRSWYIFLFQLPWLPEQMLRTGNGQGLVKSLTQQTSRIPAAHLEAYRINAVSPGGAKAMLDYYRANAAVLFSAPRQPEPITTPVLMVWGDKDVAFAPGLASESEKYVSDLVLKRLPSASHWVLEDAPEQVGQAIEGWAKSRGLVTRI